MLEHFGRYRLDELLGRGGMGEVWKAFDMETRRPVALKRLLPELAADADFQRRFRRESELAAGLTEPHIIPIHHYGEIHGRLYIDMRLVSGHDLASRLVQRGPLSSESAVAIVQQIALALDAAHDKGLVHRDVKPSNVLIERSHVYLIDFGISRAVETTGHPITGEGKLFGTMDYIAPERFDGVNEDRRIDVYSLACVLFEALTGEKAFPGGNRGLERSHRPPPRPSVVRPGVPEAFNSVVGRGLAKEPQSRYATAGELATAAREALRSAGPRQPKAPVGAKAGPPGPTKERPSTKAMPAAMQRPLRVSRSRDRRRLIGGAVAVCVAGALAGWVFLAPAGGDPGIQVGDSPSAIVLDPNGTTAYVANSGSDTLSVVDLGTRAVPVTIPVGDSPQAIAVQGRRGYVVNSGSNSVSIIDLDEREVVATIPVGDGPTAVALTPDGTRAYVSNGDSADISVIDTAAVVVTSTIGVSSLPGNSLSGIAVSPDGTRVLVSMTSWFSDDVVQVLETTGGRVVADIRVGEAPRDLVISEDGLRAYVANSTSASVSVIDVTNNAVTTDVPVGGKPLNVVLSPDGRRAYVTNSSDGTFSAIDTATNLAAPPVPAGANPIEMAVSPDESRAYVVSPDSNTVAVLELA